MSVNNWIGGNITATLSGGTNYFGFANVNAFTSTTETDVRCKYPAGTASMLSVFIGSVSGTPTMTARFRKNTANGNQVVTTGAGGTGWQQDSTHSDTTVDGDQVSGNLAPSGASVTFNGAASIQFVHASDGVQLYQTNATVNLGSGSNGNESPFGGTMAFGGATADYRTQLPTAATLSHLIAVVTNQVSAGTIVFITKKAGAAGNQTVSFASGVNGDAEDTTHTDAVAANDQWSFSYSGITTNFTGARSIKVRSNNAGAVAADTVSGDESIALSSTYTSYFMVPNGGAQDQKNATETLAQTKAPYALSNTNLRLHLRSNTVNQAISLKARVNAATGNGVATLASGTNGWAVDNTHTDTLAAGDLASVMFSTTSNSGSYVLKATGWTLGAASSTETGTASLAFGPLAFNGAGSVAHAAGGTLAFGPLRFTAAGQAIVTGTGALAFGPLRFVGAGVAGHLATVALHFGAIKFLAIGANTGTSPSPTNPVVENNSALNELQPLTWNVPIADKNSGNPTPEFQRKWQKQFDVIKKQFTINQTIVPQSYIDAAVNQATNVALTSSAAAQAAAIAYTDKRLLANCAVAALPASPDHGTRGYVTDATAPTFGSAVVGGGAVEIPVYFDGTWKVG